MTFEMDFFPHAGIVVGKNNRAPFINKKNAALAHITNIENYPSVKGLFSNKRYEALIPRAFVTGRSNAGSVN